jgi:hypothetical protein
VVITVGAFADIEVRRLLCTGGETIGAVVELSEEADDIAEEKVPIPLLAYASPLRNGGASYVTPNSGCWQ